MEDSGKACCSKGGLGVFVLILAGAIGAGAISGLVAGGISKRINSSKNVDALQEEPAVLEQAAPPAVNPYAGFRVTDFSLVDSEGEAIDQSVFDGELTVLTFFFTSCNGPCPVVARVMKQIQDRTAGTKLRLASISVDGGRDTPEAVASFAESYGADLARWRFMTGDPELVRDLVRKSIGFELREQADVEIEAPDGRTMNNILHPTRLLLVGPDRTLVGVYPFNDPDQVEELISDSRKALE